MRIMEKNMETTIVSYIGVIAEGLGMMGNQMEKTIGFRVYGDWGFTCLFRLESFFLTATGPLQKGI